MPLNRDGVKQSVDAPQGIPFIFDSYGRSPQRPLNLSDYDPSETFVFLSILEAIMTPMSQPAISDEFLALLGGAIKHTGF
jgi:hypothetical protein